METKNHIEEAEEYLRKNLKKGYKIYDLKLLLKKQGYSDVAVNKAILKIEKEIEKKEQEQEKQQQARIIVEKNSESETEVKQSKFFSFLEKIKSFFKFPRNKDLKTDFD